MSSAPGRLAAWATLPTIHGPSEKMAYSATPSPSSLPPRKVTKNFCLSRSANLAFKVRVFTRYLSLPRTHRGFGGNVSERGFSTVSGLLRTSDQRVRRPIEARLHRRVAQWTKLWRWQVLA